MKQVCPNLSVLTSSSYCHPVLLFTPSIVSFFPPPWVVSGISRHTFSMLATPPRGPPFRVSSNRLLLHLSFTMHRQATTGATTRVIMGATTDPVSTLLSSTNHRSILLPLNPKLPALPPPTARLRPPNTTSPHRETQASGPAHSATSGRAAPSSQRTIPSTYSPSAIHPAA